MVDQLVEEQLTEFMETFSSFNLDAERRLSMEELRVVLDTLGVSPSEGELQTMLADVTTDEAGRLDFADFLALMARRLKDTESDDELIEAFKVFDRDGDGFISAEELRDCMTNLGESLSSGEVDEMVREADLDRDGLLNFDEFVKMLVCE